MFDWLRNINAGSKWWHWSYFPEWLLTGLVSGSIWAAFHFTDPLCRELNPADPSIGHPYSHDNMFPSWTIPLVGWLVPFVWCLCIEAFVRFLHTEGGAEWMHVVHSVALAMVEALALALCITDPIKNFAGRMRPDYVSRLKEFMDFNVENYTQADLDAACTTTLHVIRDGRKSFPSGHSSLTFAGWSVAALFVYTTCFKGTRIPPILGVFIVALNMIMPSVVAVSRTRDYRHNYSDVLAGTCIGVLCGVVCFQLHFSINQDVPRNRKKKYNEDLYTPLGQPMLPSDDMEVPMTAF